ncbi:AMPN Aminopeptidase, partial [Polypterus senegalus]
MGKGFYISKTLAVVGILFAATAVATIIALAVVYSEAKSKNEETIKTSAAPEVTSQTSQPTTSLPPNYIWNRYRLPDSLVPISYDVLLWPKLDTYIFTGNSTVIFKCKKATNYILIHCNKLNLTNFGDHYAIISTEDGSKDPVILKSFMEEKTQYLVLELQEELEVEKSYRLFTSFVGELADDLAGFYRSEYVENGEKRVVATTQMQAADARKAFPCFDEPAMKAVFNITLIHKPTFSALSNSPVKEVKQITVAGENWDVTSFEPTPKMSTYLLAFIVCDFGHIQSEENNISISIWARKNAINEGQGQYALNKTGSILSFFESYYNVKYPLPKSDQIALPDFNAGAMENWGLVTYRETALLYSPKISSIGNKERVVTVIAHELAHQWFGNLVTLKWWNDLWLNEGFASYVEYLGADNAEPEWNIKDLIVLNDVHRVFAVDALASSHPLTSEEEEINTPAQISELFDSISYSKGASVLRMLSEFLTEKVFLQGLTSYLTAFEYSNTVYQNLWDHLQQALNSQTEVKLPETVSNIMNRWTLQMGFPVVTINTQNGNISQEHFLLNRSSIVNRTSPYHYVWFVPITWMKPGENEKTYWMLNKSEIVNDFATSGDKWILANINVTGYYRVNYDMENWDRLRTQLETGHNVIPVINRAQIIDDAFNLARANYIQSTDALDMTKYLRNEVEFMPWESAIDNLGYYILMFDRTEVNGPMQAYLRNQVTPLYRYFKNITKDWKEVPTGLTEQYNQINAISIACSNGLTECRDLAVDLYQQWMNDSNNNPIHPNLRTTIYCNAIAAGREQEWDFGWEMFKNASIATEADKLRSALACTKQPWLLNRYLEYSLKPDKIRKQDATSTIVYIANNVVGQPLAWDFVRANWAKIYEQYGGGSFSFSNLIDGVTKRFSTTFELQQLEQFWKDNQHIGFGSGERALQQALERTTANIQWVNANKEKVLKWFRDNTPQ